MAQLYGQVPHVHPQEGVVNLSRICLSQNGAHVAPDLPPGAPIGQSIGNYKKNYRQVWQYLCRVGIIQCNTGSASLFTFLEINSDLSAQTVCTYWLKGLCMKGDTCGFLHEFNPERMPVCRSLLKYGICKEPDCPYKHSLTDIKVYHPSVDTPCLPEACFFGVYSLSHLMGLLLWLSTTILYSAGHVLRSIYSTMQSSFLLLKLAQNS